MNLQYLRYALEISRTGSISKAAENLSVAQPNLSRAVKELESQLGIAIFDRTRTGMTVTPEGEKLLSAGERILRDVSELETMFDGETALRQSFSVICPSSAYLTHAFLSFCQALPADGRYELTQKDCTAARALTAVAEGECKLGILRYPIHFDRYYTELAAKHGLVTETVHEFSPVAVAGLGSPLTARETVAASDLAGLTEVTCPDALRAESDWNAASERPALALSISDRAARYEFLAGEPMAYHLSDPLPPSVASRYGLIQRPLQNGERYRDVLVYPKGYRLTPMDDAYVRALSGTVRFLPTT